MSTAKPVLVEEREAAATYEALVLLRYWIASHDRTKLPYSEGDAARVQGRILEAFPRLKATYTGANQAKPRVGGS
jgi:hypothetical protein